VLWRLLVPGRPRDVAVDVMARRRQILTRSMAPHAVGDKCWTLSPMVYKCNAAIFVISLKFLCYPQFKRRRRILTQFKRRRRILTQFFISNTSPSLAPQPQPAPQPPSPAAIPPARAHRIAARSSALISATPGPVLRSAK
jgi:hypothetical protein